MVTSAHGTSAARQRRQQLTGARVARRRRAGRRRLDPVEQQLDDAGGVEVEAHPLADVDARVDEVGPDQGVRVGVRPRRAVLGRQGVLGGEPAGLGVGQRAVEVPQRRRPAVRR